MVIGAVLGIFYSMGIEVIAELTPLAGDLFLIRDETMVINDGAMTGSITGAAIILCQCVLRLPVNGMRDALRIIFGIMMHAILVAGVLSVAFLLIGLIVDIFHAPGMSLDFYQPALRFFVVGMSIGWAPGIILYYIRERKRKRE